MQKLFQEEKNKTERTSEDIDKLMEFSLFMAEMFYRVKVGNDQVVSYLRNVICMLYVTYITGDMGARASSYRVNVYTH